MQTRHCPALRFRPVSFLGLFCALGLGWFALPTSEVRAQQEPPAKTSLPVLTRAEQIRNLTPDQAGFGYPVRLRAVITYCDLSQSDLFVEDATGSIYVDPSELKAVLHAGQYVEVEGTSSPGDFSSEVTKPRITILGEAPIPRPQKITAEGLMSGNHDTRWVEVEGVVRSVIDDEGRLRLSLASGATSFDAYVLDHPSAPPALVGAKIRLRGVSSGVYTDSDMYISAALMVPSLTDLYILEHGPADLFSLPVRPIHFLLRSTPEGAFNRPVRLQGVVTLQRLGQVLYVHDGKNAVQVNTRQMTPLGIGDLIDVVGFPALGEYTPILAEAIFRRIGAGRVPPPVTTTASLLLLGAQNGELVRISGRLIDHTIQSGQVSLELVEGELTFKAEIADPKGRVALASFRNGSYVQLTGICSVEADYTRRPHSLSILLRSPEDIVVLRSPSWWTLKRTLGGVGVMAGLILAALAWVVLLRRRVGEQTATIHEQLRREAALKERYQELFENANDVVFTCGLRGHFTSLNKAGQRITGYSLPEAIGKNLTQMVAPEYSALAQQIIQRDGAQEGPAIHELEMVSKDGRRVPLEVSIRFICDEGFPVAIQGIARDITERKQSEQALRDNQQRLDLALQSGQMSAWDLDLVHDAVIRSLHHDQIFGYATLQPAWSAEIFFRHVVPGDRERVQHAFEEAYISGLLAFECRINRTDGSLCWIAAKGQVYRDPQGTPVRMLGVVADISERKRAEEALRESEEKHRTLFETMAQGAVYQNAEGHIISANRAAERLLGLTLAEMLGRTSMDPRWKAIHEDGSDFPGDTHAAMIALKTGKEVSHVVMGVFHPGANEYAWINIHAVPQFRPGETKPYQVYTTFDDITARKRAEEALHESGERYRSLVEAAPDVIYTVSAEDGSLTSLNPAFETLTGWLRAEWLGKPLVGIVHPDDLPVAVETLQKASRGETQPPYELRVLSKSGEYLVGEFTSTPHVKDGKVVGELGIAHDITERKRAEEALRESQEMFQKAFHASPDTMVLHTLSEGRYIDVNESFLRLVGYRREELVGRTAMDLGLWWDLAQGNEYLRVLREQGRVRDLEICVRTKSGEARTLLLSAEVIEIAGQDCVVAIGKDISHRKLAEQERLHLEEQLRQAQKMEAVGRLAGGVAHDFNNILMVINGYVQLVLRRLSPRHPLRQNLNEIRKAGERAASLTGQLLAFSRRQFLVPRILDLNKVVADTKEMLRRVIGEDVELVIRQGCKLAKVLADPGQIAQVLVNLAVNARDAMPGGGRLTIETGNVDLREAETGDLPGAAPGPYVMLAVSDTGVGMSKELMEHMFEPFFTTRERGKGTGLGLSTVYGIVKQSGGYVRAQSEPGQGSAFRIYLPCARVGSGKPAARSGKARLAKGRETVLVVEDELAVRQVVAATLRSCGYKVLEARSGEEGMRRLRRHEGPLHLLLTDLVMPRMNGRKVADSVRTLYPEVKVVFMSGYTDDALLRHGVSDTQGSFLQKPFTMETLTQEVREVLGE